MLPWQDSKSLILESDLRLSMLPEEEAPRARAGIDSLMGLYCLVPTSGDQKCMQGFFAYPSHQIQSKFAVSQSNLGSSHSCLSYTHPTTSRVEDRTLSRNGVQIFLVQPVDPVDTCESCSDACRAKLDCLIHDECQFCVLFRDVESNYRARDVCIPMQGGGLRQDLDTAYQSNSGVNRHGFKIPDRRAHLFDARMLDRGFDPWTRRPLLFTPGKHQVLARSRPDKNHKDYPKEFGKGFPHMTQEEVREL
ncbi:hypothetical protein FGSG_13588 [Fusarium graminearum PH-1]|uniref:hypothetical protein n=1 Tax=Gibberella zeae (strain ATCC MYA-4620 / CBS 123657 / FGSC 9075 / NRRL 31084 / PH-1) TaxID=229533 RepID=UPI00021F12F3|nr:hypothetical protein FGSG_13588 [Fusarium graminearum PH-1]ESU16040.1 hypothetical protein FGSG_13588 [Fusarium graminearum PH-1]|eukprot:XP_011328276.1 hypothetical protein FGSG_13588 [Fusarium graminearum PH-1]